MSDGRRLKSFVEKYHFGEMSGEQCSPWTLKSTEEKKAHINNNCHQQLAVGSSLTNNKMAGTTRREEQPLEESSTGHSTPLTDIVIIGEERITVPSRVFLAAESPVFAAMYDRLEATREASQGSQLEISDVRADVFKDLLMFATCCIKPESGRLTTELLALAHKFQVTGLKEVCEEHLATRPGLSADTVLPRLLFAHRHGAALLKRSCLQFLVAHFGEVVDTEAFEVFLESAAAVVDGGGELVDEAMQALAEYRRNSH